MPKKTSRSARALQAQRTSLTGERKNTARPLLDVSSSRLAAAATAPAALGQLDAVYEEKPQPVSALNVNGNAVSTATRPAIETRSSSPASIPSTIRPAGSTRRPLARRTSTAVTRAPAISREEEYAYIRSDLLTVLILTILMVAILVVLTFYNRPLKPEPAFKAKKAVA